MQNVDSTVIYKWGYPVKIVLRKWVIPLCFTGVSRQWKARLFWKYCNYIDWLSKYNYRKTGPFWNSSRYFEAAEGLINYGTWRLFQNCLYLLKYSNWQCFCEIYKYCKGRHALQLVCKLIKKRRGEEKKKDTMQNTKSYLLFLFTKIQKSTIMSCKNLLLVSSSAQKNS